MDGEVVFERPEEVQIWAKTLSDTILQGFGVEGGIEASDYAVSAFRERYVKLANSTATRVVQAPMPPRGFQG